MAHKKSCKKTRGWFSAKDLLAVFNSFLISLLFLCTFSLKAYCEEVAIIVSGDLSVYRLALEGFQDKSRYSAKEFFLDKDSKQNDKIVSAIKSVRPKLIFAIGATAAQIAKSNFPGKPLVFSLVANPSRYELEDKNVYGVRLDVSPSSQLEFLRKVAPNTKKVGIIYDPDRTQEILSEIKKESSNFDLQIVAVKVGSKREVADAIRSLEGKIDAFWLITDPIVANSVVFERLLLSTLSNKIPLLCPAKAFVKKGGLLSLDVDFRDLGNQAAKIANDILGSQPQAGDYDAIQWPNKVKLILNLKIAKTIGLSVPQSVIDEANEVIKNNHND